MSEEERLVEKLRRVEALFARPGAEGERLAAERARERILVRLRDAEKADPAVEYRFSLPDQWSRRLFIALLRRYGISPYRYHGQRRTTVMARVSRKFVRETLWPEVEALQATLRDYFDDFTSRIIVEALDGDPRDAEERGQASGHAAKPGRWQALRPSLMKNQPCPARGTMARLPC